MVSSPRNTQNKISAKLEMVGAITVETSNLSKAHVTCDSIDPAPWAISLHSTACNKIITCLEKVRKFEASVCKTP